MTRAVKLIGVVHRRIGGLEKNRKSRFHTIIVHRRIGGLEMSRQTQGVAMQVHRRIGGLERLVRKI